MKDTILKEELRQFLVNYHNLNDYESLAGKDGVMKYFNRVGSIQYDPLNGRSVIPTLFYNKVQRL